jgi:hypothetical protein
MPRSDLKRNDRPPCTTHGSGCKIVYAQCAVEVDPNSDPAKVPCARHGAWCKLRHATCKRRRCSCEPLMRQVAELIVESRAGRELTSSQRRDLVEGELLAMITAYEREHFSDGTPSPTHPVLRPVEVDRVLVVKIREAEDLIGAEPETVATKIAHLRRDQPDLILALEWEAALTGQDFLDLVEAERDHLQILTRWRRREREEKAGA